jgi:hypothetical protein
LWPSSTDATSFGILAILALSDVQDIFGVLDVLAFGNIHAFGNVQSVFGVLAILNLSILALLVAVWHGTVIVASREQQHEISIVAWELHSSFPCICCFIVVASSNTT